MKPVAFNLRAPVTVIALSALLALAACGKKVDTTTPANTAAPAVTTPMPDSTSSAPMGGSSSSMGSTGSTGSSGSTGSTGSYGSTGSSGSSGSMSSPSTSGGSVTTPTPGAATGSVPNNDSSPAPVAPASAVR